MIAIAVIPARYASTRLPGKPLVDLEGRPMIQHVYERASRARLVGRVMVATDHPDIAEAVRAFGGEVVMTPETIRTGSDRAAYVARDVPEADIVVNIQGDEPLLDPAAVDAAVRPLLEDGFIGVGTLVHKISTPEELLDPSVVKAVLDGTNRAVYFSRAAVPFLRDEPDPRSWLARQDYYKHIGLYAFRRRVLLDFCEWPESRLERIEQLEQLRLLEHGIWIQAALTERDSPHVDVPADIEKVRRLLRRHAEERHAGE